MQAVPCCHSDDCSCDTVRLWLIRVSPTLTHHGLMTQICCASMPWCTQCVLFDDWRMEHFGCFCTRRSRSHRWLATVSLTQKSRPTPSGLQQRRLDGVEPWAWQPQPQQEGSKEDKSWRSMRNFARHFTSRHALQQTHGEAETHCSFVRLVV